jgi:hypothetical protein
MHLRIIPDHQKLFFKKDIFDRLEWLKTCFDAFAHTSRSPETFFQKRYFFPRGVVKSVFWCITTYLQTNRNFFSKEIFFTVWSGYKRVLMHFRKLPYHQKPFFRKDIFYCQGWLKTCFYAFAHTFRSSETFFQKRYFLLSGVVKKVFFMHLRILPDHQKLFSEKIFWTVRSG